MNLVRYVLAATCVGLAAALVIGCGGSGSSNNGSTGGLTSDPMFITSSANGNFSDVWVTVDKVSVTSRGTTTTVFDDTAAGGVVMDLTLLSRGGAIGYYMFGNANIGAAPQVITLTLNSAASVVPVGSSMATNVTFAGATGATVNIPISVSGSSLISNAVVLNLDLANWTLAGTTLSANGNRFATLGSAAGINANGIYYPLSYFGTVSNLSGAAPNSTFSLTNGNLTTNFKTTSPTAVWNANGSVSPVLQNGDVVVIRGAFDFNTGMVGAAYISILPAGTVSAPPLIAGTVTSSDAASNTIVLQPRDVTGFVPTQTSYQVATTGNVVFFDSNGDAVTPSDFYAELVNGSSQIEVFTSAVTSGTVTPISVTMSRQANQPAPGETQIEGTGSNFNSTAGTFSVSVSQWNGWNWTAPTTANVVTNSSTQYEVNGAAATSGAFWTAVGQNAAVTVTGEFNSTTGTVSAAEVNAGTQFP